MLPNTIQGNCLIHLSCAAIGEALSHVRKTVGALPPPQPAEAAELSEVTATVGEWIRSERAAERGGDRADAQEMVRWPGHPGRPTPQRWHRDTSRSLPATSTAVRQRERIWRETGWWERRPSTGAVARKTSRSLPTTSTAVGATAAELVAAGQRGGNRAVVGAGDLGGGGDRWRSGSRWSVAK